MADHPETHYATTADGVHVAYQVIGDGPIDVLFVMGWVTNIEWMWTLPEIRKWFDRMSTFARVLIFDKRGVGLSDRVSVDALLGNFTALQHKHANGSWVDWPGQTCETHVQNLGNPYDYDRHSATSFDIDHAGATSCP